jgi:hypothetical protein
LKKLIYGVSAFALMFAFAESASATAFPNPDNQQIVAYYTTGDHGIPGEPYLHTGQDAVKANGKSGNFQQWFYGWSAEDGGIIEGDHSVWKVEGPIGCAEGWLLMITPNPAWGVYLVPNVNYCVKTNDYKVSK